MDGSGNVFVADDDNNAVKEILAVRRLHHCVNTLGGGFSFPHGRGGGRKRQCLRRRYRQQCGEGDSGGGRLLQLVKTLGSGFTALGVAVDGSGNVFVADSNNNAVKEILAAGGYATSTRWAAASTARGVAVDGSGNVFVADNGNEHVGGVETGAGDFGTIAIGQTSAMVPLTFTFDNGGTIGSSVALTQGAVGLDFAVASGGTCVADVRRGRYLHGECDLCAEVRGSSQRGSGSEGWRRRHHRHCLHTRHRLGAAAELPSRQPGHAAQWFRLSQAWRWTEAGTSICRYGQQCGVRDSGGRWPHRCQVFGGRLQ